MRKRRVDVGVTNARERAGKSARSCTLALLVLEANVIIVNLCFDFPDISMTIPELPLWIAFTTVFHYLSSLQQHI